MRLTICICTWNRASALDRCLWKLRELHVPDGVSLEFLVVDNNSTDATADVVSSHSTKLPVRRILETVQGISHARNRAIAEATGELLLFTDDDCLVDSHWLAAYVEASRRWPDASIFGGPIEPHFAAKPPSWITANLDRLSDPFAIIRDDPSIRLLRAKEHLYNANMAFRSLALMNCGYDTNFGRVGEGTISGEEIELINRLRDLGHKIVWVGTAHVKHHIPPDRVTPKYLWHWHRCSGRTIARMDGPADCRLMFGVPRWALRRFWSEWILFWALRPLKTRRWVESLRISAYAQGILDEAWATRRQRRSKK